MCTLRNMSVCIPANIHALKSHTHMHASTHTRTNTRKKLASVRHYPMHRESLDINKDGVKYIFYRPLSQTLQRVRVTRRPAWRLAVIRVRVDANLDLDKISRDRERKRV